MAARKKKESAEAVPTFWQRWSWYDSVYSGVVGVGIGAVGMLIFLSASDTGPVGALSLGMPYMVFLGKVFLLCLFAGLTWAVAKTPRKHPPVIDNKWALLYHSRVSIYMFVLALLSFFSLAPEVLDQFKAMF